MEKIFKNLAAFQQEVPVVHKGTQGFGYSYADLPAIFDVINPLMKKHNLGFTQIMVDYGLRTVVFCTEDNSQIEGTVEIPKGVELAKMNPFQVEGSAITYYRRYALSAMLGLVTDKDVDASSHATSNKSAGTSKQKLDQTHPKWKAIVSSLRDGKVSVSKVKETFDMSTSVEKILTSEAEKK